MTISFFQVEHAFTWLSTTWTNNVNYRNFIHKVQLGIRNCSFPMFLIWRMALMCEAHFKYGIFSQKKQRQNTVKYINSFKIMFRSVVFIDLSVLLCYRWCTNCSNLLYIVQFRWTFTHSYNAKYYVISTRIWIWKTFVVCWNERTKKIFVNELIIIIIITINVQINIIKLSV